MSSKKSRKILKTTLGKAPCESQQEQDLSHLGKPIATGINGLRHVLSLIQTATSEVKRYITYECDIMYECRICRSIFRSLANFVLHKREYCRDVYNPLDHTNCRNRCQEQGYYVKQPEENVDSDSEKSTDCQPKVAENKKTMTSVLQKLLERQENNKMVENILNQDISNESQTAPERKENANDVALESIETTDSAVFQTMFKNMIQEHSKMDFMKNEVMELHGIFSSDEAVIGPDGKILQFETDKINAKECIPKNNLLCTICNQKFSTRKTLTHHLKYKHNETRMVYPCPVCTDQFANAWCVFRHLYKVHRKTSTQIRKMRDQIHASAFRKDQEPLKKKGVVASISNEIQLNDNSENQWMENIEGDNDLQMCGGCGRRFERKAALHSHSQLCTKRIAVCNTIKENSSKIAQEEKQEAKVHKNIKCAKMVTDYNVQGAEKRKPLIIRRKCNSLETEKSNEVMNFNNSECIRVSEENTSLADVVNNFEVNMAETSGSSTISIELSTKDTIVEEDESLENEMPVPEMMEVLNIIGIPVANKIITPYVEETDKHTPDVKNESPVEDNIQNIGVVSAESEVIYIDDDSNDEKMDVSEKDADKQHTKLNEDIQSVLYEIMLLNNQENEEIPVETNLEITGGAKKRKRSFSVELHEEEINDVKKSSATLEAKVEKYIDKKSLTCLPCNMKFDSNYYLMTHMSKHFSWFCYQCIKCSFMSYFKTTCVLHAYEIHRQPVNLATQNILPIPNWKTIEMSTSFHPLENDDNNVKEMITSESDMNVTDKVNVTDTDIIAINDQTDMKDPVTRKMIMEVIFGSNFSTASSEEHQPVNNDEKLNNAYSLSPVHDQNEVSHDKVLYGAKQSTKSTAIILNYPSVLPTRNESEAIREVSEAECALNSVTSPVLRVTKPVKVYMKKTNTAIKKAD